MLDWILNPYGVSLGAYVIVWIALLVLTFLACPTQIRPGAESRTTRLIALMTRPFKVFNQRTSELAWRPGLLRPGVTRERPRSVSERAPQCAVELHGQRHRQ
jgi:hypothetical protein